MDCSRLQKKCAECDAWRTSRSGVDASDRKTAEKCAWLKSRKLKAACDAKGIDEEKTIALNAKVMDALSRLHDDWVERGDIFALLEANYLVDYYCTFVANACDGEIAYDRKNDAMDKHVKSIAIRRRLHWKVKDDTHDVFRRRMTYWNGFEKIRKHIFALRNEVAESLKAGIRGTGWRTRTILKVADGVDIDELLRCVKRAIDADATYFASGWGMYRFANLNNYTEKKKPCSCICRSLLILSLLYMCGVPSERLFAHFQKREGKKTRRFTHWAVSCEDTAALVKKYANRLKHLVSAEERRFNTSEAFAAFTRDIVFYYLRAVKEFDYSSQDDRLARKRALTAFKREYDERYDAIADAVRTPSASRGGVFLSAHKI